jgi:dolichol kinase
MLKLALALVPIGCVLLLSELLWRKKVVKGERARKFIHILAGVWIAFWPLYLPFDGIFILGCVALTLLLYSRYTHLFHAIYAVKRRTIGDILFAVAIVLSAYFAQADWIFTVSILFMALADGGAALVGRYWGKGNRYYVFGSKNLEKSVAGTVAFLVLAYVSIGIGWMLGGDSVMQDNVVVVFLLMPFIAAVMENTMPYGFDNLFSPLVATILLNSLI